MIVICIFTNALLCLLQISAEFARTTNCSRQKTFFANLDTYQSRLLTILKAKGGKMGRLLKDELAVLDGVKVNRTYLSEYCTNCNIYVPRWQCRWWTLSCWLLYLIFSWSGWGLVPWCSLRRMSLVHIILTKNASPLSFILTDCDSVRCVR